MEIYLILNKKLIYFLAKIIKNFSLNVTYAPSKSFSKLLKHDKIAK